MRVYVCVWGEEEGEASIVLPSKFLLNHHFFCNTVQHYAIGDSFLYYAPFVSLIWEARSGEKRPKALDLPLRIYHNMDIDLEKLAYPSPASAIYSVMDMLGGERGVW